MIVANFVTNRATMGDTRTYEDFISSSALSPINQELYRDYIPN